MKREEQQMITAIAKGTFTHALNQLEKENPCAFSIMNPRQMREAGAKRLRSASAYVFETTDFYILQSYETFIACIDKNTDTCFDCLRITYGYTATSAKHVSMFRHDYGAGKWGCVTEYTAR